jgi:hypothetical protein
MSSWLQHSCSFLKLSISTLQTVYRSMISRGLEINIFDKKIKFKDIYGNLLNKNN